MTAGGGGSREGDKKIITSFIITLPSTPYLTVKSFFWFGIG